MMWRQSRTEALIEARYEASVGAHQVGLFFMGVGHIVRAVGLYLGVVEPEKPPF